MAYFCASQKNTEKRAKLHQQEQNRINEEKDRKPRDKKQKWQQGERK